MLDVKTAHPLSQWLMGTLTLHFDGGAVVEQRVHLDVAKRVQRMFDKEQESDFLGWSALKWLQWDSSRVVFSSFEVAEDGGWPLKAEEREALARVDHPHGILRSLVDWWEMESESEPCYSLVALHTLHRAAVEGMEREAWNAFARRTEGEAGTRRLLAAVAAADHSEARATSVQADDSAEPEEAHGEPGEPGSGPADEGAEAENDAAAGSVDEGREEHRPEGDEG